MPDKPKDEAQPTQQTEKGLTIPVPARDEIEDALQAIAKPKVSDRRLLRRGGKK
jgi:hypothetical protein